VTKPFAFEGPRRMKQAERGLAELHATVDCVISIPNDRLIELVPPGTSFFEAFRLADDVLRQGVQGISDIITTPGLINRDFADVRAIMVGMGFAIMGTASARGPNAAVEAARGAIACPLLEEGGLEGARAILLNISASPNLSLHDLHQACQLIKEATGNPDVQINFGLVADASLEDEVRITVIATGFQREGLPEVERPPVSIPRTAGQQAPKAAPEAPRIPEPPVEEPRSEPAPAPLHAEAQPEPEPLDVFDLEPLPQETRPVSGPPPQAAPPQAGPPDDIFSFDDLETPPVLKRERKLF
ncbi:MAG: cell division protein FtsZ, partial [Bryobacteraceae bacterium]